RFTIFSLARVRRPSNSPLNLGHDSDIAEFPLWVKSGRSDTQGLCPLYPRKRTSCSVRKPRLGGRRSGRICDGLVCYSGEGRGTHCSAEVAVFGRSAVAGTT